MLSPSATESIYLTNVTSFLNEKIYGKVKNVLDQQAKKTKTQHTSNIFHDYKRYNYLPFNLLREVSADEVMLFKNCLIRTRKNEKVTLKNKLAVNRQLIELLGIFGA